MKNEKGLKLATIIISILLISVLITACQPAVEPVDTGKAEEVTEPTGLEEAEDIDIIAEDEIDIGELI